MPKSILILEDNQDILDVVRETLIYEQFEVHGTTKSDEVITMVQNLAPNLIILDFRVTGTNGGEICRQIKQHPEFGNIPVIMFSAYINKNSELFQYGCDDIIYKPFDLDELVKKVNVLLK
jgi:DNA-binding response OmpR family regulator